MLEALVSALEASRDSRDPQALMALDARVHRFVHHAAANPYLEETLGRYFNLSLRIWHLVLAAPAGAAQRACTTTAICSRRSATATRSGPAP